MVQIKGLEFRDGKLFILTVDNETIECKKRPGVFMDESGEATVSFDLESMEFVCGSDEAEATLRGLLARVMVEKTVKMPAFIKEDPLLSHEVAKAAIQGRKGRKSTVAK